MNTEKAQQQGYQPTMHLREVRYHHERKITQTAVQRTPYYRTQQKWEKIADIQKGAVTTKFVWLNLPVVDSDDLGKNIKREVEDGN